MAIYDQSSAAKTNAPSNVQKEESPEGKKNRPQDLVPEENKPVQKKDEGTTPPTDDKAKTEGGDKAKTDPEAEKKAAAEEAKKKREAEVTATWSDLLGKWLGGEMAKVVLDSVSLDALNGYVQDGLKAGGGAIGDLIKDQTKTTDAKQIEGIKKFSEALNGVLTGQIDTWMKSPGAQKVLASISTWVQDNPKAVLAIVGAAVIGGAVAAWCANPSVDISVPLGLGNDWELKAGINLGKLKDMAYQGASIVVGNKSTKIEIGHKVEEKDGKKTQSAEVGVSTENKLAGGTLFKGSSNVKIGEQDVTVKLNGALTTTIGGKTIELEGGYETDGLVKGKIKIGEGGEYQEIQGTKKGDEVTFSTKSVFAGGSVETKSGTDGKGKDTQQTTATANVGKGQTATMTAGTEGNKVGYENKDVGGSGVGINASAGTNKDGQAELTAGAKYDKGMLKSSLDLTMMQGKGSLNLGASLNTKDGWKFDSTLKVDETRLTELGLKMGYQNPDEFKGFLLGYKKQWVADNSQYADKFDMLLEYSVGKWYGRVTGGFDIMGGQVKKTNLDLGLGYQMNKDWMLTAGVQQNGMMNPQANAMDMSYRGYVGAQYGGVGVALFHDNGGSGKSTTGLMLTIPFRRGK